MPPRQRTLIGFGLLFPPLVAVAVWWIFLRVEVPEPSVSPRSGPVPLPHLAESFGQRTHACQTNQDCVMSALTDGECCPALCEPGNAVSREFHEALYEQRSISECEKHQYCPVAKCPRPCREYRAVCKSGRCTEQVSELRCGPDG